MPSFWAAVLAQTAMESPTMQSGLSLSISRQTGSSRARRVSTSTRVDKARSEPTLAPACRVRPIVGSRRSHPTNSPPAARIFSRNPS